jgi:hypothetical protein
MWILKYLICLARNHAYDIILLGKSPYRYCLRCGRVEPISGVNDVILTPVAERVK